MRINRLFILNDPYTETGSLTCQSVLEPLRARGFSIHPVPSDFIRSGELLDYPESVLILPGSADGDHYRLNLEGVGFHNERIFMEAGGKSLRICATAYMAYESYGFYNARYNSLHPLFQGHAQGPVEELYRPHQTWRTLLNTHDIAILQHFAATGKTAEAAAAYSAGPRLPEPEEENCRIIARFRDAVDQTPAVIAKRIGKGLSLVSSVALEINGAYMKDRIQPVNEKFTQMQAYAHALAVYEPQRSMLWNDVWDNYLIAKEPAI